MTIQTSDIRWISPVRVKIGYGFPETIRSPREALDHLQFRWPAVDGPHYRLAKTLCTDVLEQSASPEVARTAFIEACREARMLDGIAA